MIFESKFEPNELMYPVSLRSAEVWIPCSGCDSKGYITLADGEEAKCPKCYGDKGSHEWKPRKWLVDIENIGNVGKIQITYYHKQNRYRNENGVTYMLTSTGVGSGTVWDEEDLFKTSDEAHAECDKRNQEQGLA